MTDTRPADGSAETMPLTVYWHRKTIAHEPPAGSFKLPSAPFLAVDEPHPDQPARVENIKAMLESGFGDRAQFESASPASREALLRVHDGSYVDWLREFSADGGGRIDGTTTGANEATYDAARYAAGTAIAAAEAALSDDEAVPYALARPSGHHAQPGQPDGFCFFNNAAIAAEAALEAGAERVAIVDWDVHHGNGTQECFYDRDDVLYVSVHHDHGAWDPQYHPQEGSLEETGTGAGEGYTVNVPTPLGIGDRGYADVFDRLVKPVVTAYDPDLVLVSAGQDPGTADPLGRNVVTRGGFRELGRRAQTLAAKASDGRLAIVQEGGYQISHLPFATLGVLEGATGSAVELPEYGVDDPFAWVDESSGHLPRWIDAAVSHHETYWPLEES
ncbi:MULTISPECIES: arginase family protein [Natrialbaceae]|uniref:class II histone deacetylase n=1 Tax=Natrialbaceae TaxID=1644061 RepID=UPI00207D0E99|nr:class II histone deacetylase [Natronococcus sp. CG52]